MENIKQNPAENRVDRNKSHLKLQCLCEGAIMLALALLLNALKLYQFPNGGSIDLAMIPIFLFALRWGCGWGRMSRYSCAGTMPGRKGWASSCRPSTCRRPGTCWLARVCMPPPLNSSVILI